MSEGARARLREGVAEIQKLNSEVEDLKAAVQSARIAIEEDERDLETYGDLDTEITQYRVDATRRRQDARKLPDDLRARVDGKRAAEDELAQARTTLEILTSDLSDANARLKRKKDELITFAVCVVQEVAEFAAAELVGLNNRRAVLVAILESLSAANVEINGRWQKIPNSQKVNDALGGGGRLPDLPGGVSQVMAIAKRWEARIKALLQDPNAAINLPQPVNPGDIVFTGGDHLAILRGLRPFELRPED